jgi:DNA-binding response OmpR family regulator
MSLFNRKKKVLIVEDEADIAGGLEARLSLEDYEVFIAADGKDGVEKARREKPDLIIMDVMLPLLNGYEACKILKEDKATKEIPVLFLTALPRVEDTEKAFEVGGNDFLNKPYTNDRLMQKVHKYLPKKA